MTLTAKEAEDILLGTMNEKQVPTYKRAKKYFEESVKTYTSMGLTLSTTDTKLWFDANPKMSDKKSIKTLPSVKMQFVVVSIDKKKYRDFSKKIDTTFDTMSKEMDIVLKEMTEKMDELFKKMEPIMKDAFSKFDEIFDDFFGTNKKKNNV